MFFLCLITDLCLTYFVPPFCLSVFGEQSKDAGIRTLVMLDEQGGKKTSLRQRLVIMILYSVKKVLKYAWGVFITGIDAVKTDELCHMQLFHFNALPNFIIFPLIFVSPFWVFISVCCIGPWCQFNCGGNFSFSFSSFFFIYLFIIFFGLPNSLLICQQLFFPLISTSWQSQQKDILKVPKHKQKNV